MYLDDLSLIEELNLRGDSGTGELSLPEFGVSPGVTPSPTPPSTPEALIMDSPRNLHNVSHYPCKQLSVQRKSFNIS